MRKKFAQSVLVVVLGITIFQCQQERKSPFPSIESAKPLAVAVPHAIEVAESYLDFNNDATARRKLRTTNKTDPGSRKVRRTRTLKDDAGTDLMHIIEYEGESKENRGFVIVAADRRVTPILAMGDTGTFHADNPGVQIWISHVMDQVNQGKKLLKKPEKDIDALWKDFEIQADIKAGRISGEPDPHLPPGRNCPDNWEAFVPPILSTQWGQGRGYNKYCPSRSCAESDDCNKAPAGCGPIAIAQVWNAPNLRLPASLPPSSAIGAQTLNYPFNNLFSVNCNSTNEQDKQISALIWLAGNWAGSDYNFLDCNTLTWRDNINDAFASAGYSNPGTRVSWNTYQNHAVSELSWGYPAIIDGTKGTDDILKFHIWIVDGVDTWKHYVEPEDPYAQCIETWVTLYHINWGWYGSDNNWYALGNFTGSALNYRSYLNATYGFRR